MKWSKKAIALVLTLMLSMSMLFTGIPFSAFADDVLAPSEAETLEAQRVGDAPEAASTEENDVSGKPLTAGALEPDASDTAETAEQLESVVGIEEDADDEAAGGTQSLASTPLSYRPGEMIVTFKDGSQFEEKADELRSGIQLLGSGKATIELLSQSEETGITALMTFSYDTSVVEAIAEAKKDPAVVAAQPNYIYRLLGNEGIAQTEGAVGSLYVPNDPEVSSANGYWWWLYNTKATQAWDIAKTNRTVTVAVVDTGVRLTHEDLEANIDKTNAWDIKNNISLMESARRGYIANGDVDGHGTHVAGIISAVADNKVMGAGISFNAKVLPIAAFYEDKDGEWTSDTVTVSAALNHLRTLKDSGKVPDLKVVNMSFGMYDNSSGDPTMRQAILNLSNRGILCVAAAGNEGSTGRSYPSDWPEVVSVTATTQKDTMWKYSDHNAYKNIAAPGEAIASTYNESNANYAFADGTSMASPMVAGAAALLWAADSSLSVDQVKAALYNTATDLGAKGRDDYYGYGLLNVQAAVKSVTAPKITGDATISLINGYGAVSQSYTITGIPAPTVTLVDNTAKATINRGVLSIPAGLNEGTYAVTIRAANASGVVTKKITVTVSSNLSGVYIISAAENSSFALSVPGFSTANGTRLVLSANNKSITQTLRVTAKSTYYEIIQAGSGKALAVEGIGAKNGANVCQWAYNNTNNMRWRIESTGDGFYNIVSVDTDRVLDYAGNSPSTGLSLVVWQKTGANKQKFKFNKVAIPTGSLANGTYTITTAENPSLAIDLAGASSSNGTRFDLASHNSGIEQGFKVTNKGTYYEVAPVASNKALAVEGAKAGNGASVCQWTYNNTNNMRWRFESTGDGFYNIVSLDTGRLIDYAGSTPTAGLGLVVWQKTGASKQKFSLNAVSVATGALANGTYTVTSSEDPSLALNVAGSTFANGSRLNLATHNKGASQTFRVTNKGLYYEVILVASSKALAVEGIKAGNGACVCQWANNGSANMRWRIEPTGDGYYNIVSVDTERMIDYAGNSPAAGQSVVVWQKTGAAKQKFLFVSK